MKKMPTVEKIHKELDIACSGVSIKMKEIIHIKLNGISEGKSTLQERNNRKAQIRPAGPI